MSNIIEICKEYSMISYERFQNNIESIHYIQINKIEGDIVEIGVWRGGSILSMILAYEEYAETKRRFYLYDTFSGMTPPLDVDVDCNGISASVGMITSECIKAECPYADVYANIKRHAKYDMNNISFVTGDILKNTVYPEKIAILRLDTDWYESTKFELEHFYKYVVPGGVIIIDDYGHWKGCKRAVHEFLEENPEIELVPIDQTGVYFIKP